MKLARAMFADQKLLPSVSPATRNHSVSNNTPAAPDRNTVTPRSSDVLKAPLLTARSR